MNTQDQTISISTLFKMLSDAMTEESKWMLFTLYQAQKFLNKDKLRELTNKKYQEQFKLTEEDPLFIKSRYVMDVHIARLAGAGLVEIDAVGKTRIVSITKLGQEMTLFLYQSSKK